MSDIARILQDRELREELVGIITRGATMRPMALSRPSRAMVLEALRENAVPVGAGDIEAIVLRHGRPALLVRDGSFEPPESDVWKRRLEGARPAIEAAIRAVGRVEFKNHPDYEWGGTGWLVTPTIAVTNRHVASLVAYRDGDGVRFRATPNGREMACRVDLREEHMMPAEWELPIKRIRYIEPEDGPDLALLEVDPTGVAGIDPIALADGPEIDAEVAVIGYPAWDGRRNDPLVMREIFRDIYDVKRLQPGRIVSSSGEVFIHDCSTLGGNSGSPVIDLKTGMAVGLHYAGSYGKANYALPGHVIKDRLARLS